MVSDAESHAEEDKRLRALADARNNAEARAHEGERQLKEHGDTLDAELKTDLEGAIAAAKEAAQGDDTDSIEAKAQAVTDLLHKVSEQVYQRASQTQATGESQATDETVEDAEFEVIDDEPADKS